MATSRWGDVVIALAAQLRAVTGYRDPNDRGTGIPVFIGTQVGLSDMTADSFVALAWAGDPDSPEDAGDWTQDVAGHAASSRPRNEVGEIRYRVQIYRGDRDVAGSITSAMDVLADLETSVRDDPYVGLGASSNVWWTQVVQGTPRLWLDQGAVCVVEGRLRYEARL